MTSVHRIHVTDQDLTRITHLIDHPTFDPAEVISHSLAVSLERANIVAQNAIPPDVVTLNSRVAYRGYGSADTKTCTLVYPWDADHAAAKVSILSPLGAALFGRVAGESFVCTLPNGTVRRFELVSVLYQPEAAGDFHL